MSRIAVVGAGISGLSAAWLLARQHDVVLLERDVRPGGHTHTHHLDTPDGPLAVDTGFLVHNDRTYPLLVRLFDELGVARYDSDMSFGVTNRSTGFEYSTRNLNGLFADRRNLLRPAHYALVLDILRFGRRARALLSRSPDPALTLDAFLAQEHFNEAFADQYILPLASAIWSASPGAIRGFPAVTLARFFDQHGMLNAYDHPTWRCVTGGSSAYIPKLTAAPRLEVRTGVALSTVRRNADKVELRCADGATIAADQVVFACHGDEVLPMLASPTPAEREVFGAFQTTPNDTWLHTDTSFLPVRAAAQASWNYQLDRDSPHATVTYDITRLQRLPTTRRYCVTLNPARPVDPSHVVGRMAYTHPLYTVAAIRAQARWADVSGRNRTHYAGAYWYYGFHEDGLRSAVRVAEALGVTW